MSISVTPLATAVFSILSTDSSFMSQDFKMLLGEGLNEDPEQTPWCCVWPSDLDERPGYIGGPSPWRGTVFVDVYHQRYNIDCGAALMAQLKLDEDHVRALVSSDITLGQGGTVLGIKSMSGRLFDYQVKNEALFITNLVRVEFDVTG